MRMIGFLTLIGLTACGGDAFFYMPAPDGAKEDASSEAAALDSTAADSDNDDAETGAVVDACAMQPGQAACLDVVSAMCSRMRACNLAADGGTLYDCGTYPALCNQQNCVMTYGGHCQEPKYAKQACAASACAAEWAKNACSNTLPGPKEPSICAAFWAQF